MKTPVQQQLVAYARQIAQHNQYPCLIRGLQPVEDYLHPLTQEPRKGLASKYEDECQEFDAEQRHGPGIKGLLEGADVLYYAAQLEEQTGLHCWWEQARKQTQMYEFGLVQLAALLKYRLRSSRPRQKHPEREYALVEQELARLGKQIHS